MKRILLLFILPVAFILAGSACTPRYPSVETMPPAFITRAEDLGTGGMIWSQQNVGLWVTGEGKTYGTPDIAVLSLGVEVEETTVAAAQAKAAEAMNNVVRALKGRGVADRDIQTQQFNIQIVRRWLDKEQREEITGYRIVNTVVTKIRKINDTGSVIDAVAAAGGDYTRINNISFSIDDPTPYYKEARDKAVAEAMAKAKQIAGAAGIKLGKPIYITENISYFSPVVRNTLKMEAAAPAPAPTPISSGELELQITVQMVYTIN